MSNSPYLSATYFTALSMDLSLLISNSQKEALPPKRISLTIQFPASMFLPETITLAPASANRLAHASPIPDVEPDMKAVFPSNLFIITNNLICYTIHYLFSVPYPDSHVLLVVTGSEL